MNVDFINITQENLANEHLCCIIRSRKSHSGIDAKRKWISERLNEGHVFRKLNVKGTVFIEYAPLEKAWIPIIGDNYYYVYCLWVLGDYKGKGYAKKLMEYCIADAKDKGRSGICMLGAKNKKLGSPINLLRRILVSRLLILPIMDMNYSHFLLMERHRNLHKMLRTKR